MGSRDVGPVRQIAELLREPTRHPKQRRVGIEVERVGIWESGDPFLYPCAQRLLNELHKKFGWELVGNASGQPLGMHSPHGKVSLEPGSQLEISPDPFDNLAALAENIGDFEKSVDSIGEVWGLRWLPIGVNPFYRHADIDVIPSVRYGIMTDYLGRTGKYGLSMMRLTSSVQVNLDYRTEAEAVEMLRCSLLLAPLSYSIFGNSPFFEGKDSGYQSFRNVIWQHTDNDRTGFVPEAFATDFSFERYAELAWSRPLMFAQNAEGDYIPAQGKSFHQLVTDGKVKADENNCMNALRELFFESRMKPGYIEVRSIDGTTPALRYAAAAFWMGVLYHDEARAEWVRRFKSLEFSELLRWSDEASRIGMKANFGKTSAKALAEEALSAAKETLMRRGMKEEQFLAPLDEIISSQENRGAKLARLIDQRLDRRSINSIIGSA